MAQPRSGRPHKLTERDHRVLKRVACKNVCPRLQHSLVSSKLPLGSNFSRRTVSRELHEMGFHGPSSRKQDHH
jgi:transposase